MGTARREKAPGALPRHSEVGSGRVANALRSVASARADRLDRFPTGLLAATAGLRAKAAVLVHARVPLAFLRTERASLGASLQSGENDLLVAAGPARANRTRGHADVGAVEVEADALPKLSYHVLGQAGVGA